MLYVHVQLLVPKILGELILDRILKFEHLSSPIFSNFNMGMKTIIVPKIDAHNPFFNQKMGFRYMIYDFIESSSQLKKIGNLTYLKYENNILKKFDVKSTPASCKSFGLLKKHEGYVLYFKNC